MPLDAPARPRSTLLGILALWVLFYASFTLFTPPLLDDADSVHAEVAREMLLRHDYVTLYANGIRYLEKAPLLYWLMAASFRLFGVSTAAARVPLALTVLALALAVEAFARRAFRSAQAGLYAALILLSSFGIFIFTRILIPDAMVCLWLTLALYCFWLTEQNPSAEPSRRLCWIFAACCALNVLTKGLIGVVFPIAIVLIYLLLTRGARAAIAHIGQLHPLSSITLFLTIAVPWHILIALANPTQGHPGNLAFSQGHLFVPLPTQGNVHGWLWFYFVNEQLLRYFNLRVPRDYDTVPLWLFWGLSFVWLMPWSAFVIQATGRVFSLQGQAWRRMFWARVLAPQNRTMVLLFISAIVPLVFFSFSTRQEYYVLPSLPALIVLIASYLSRRSTETSLGTKSDGYATRATGGLAILGAFCAIACVWLAIRSDSSNQGADLASLLQQNPSDYALSFGHFLDLNAHALGLFRLPLVLAGVSLFFGPLVSYVLRERMRPHAATFALAAGAFGFLLAADLGLQTFAPVLSSAQLARVIAPQVRPDDLIVIHQEYEYGSTLGFYLRRPGSGGGPIHILEGRSSNLWYGSFFPDAPAIFETKQTIAERWPGPQRIFLWQDLGNRPSPLPALPGPVYVLAKSGGKEIVSNEPNRLVR